MPIHMMPLDENRIEQWEALREELAHIIGKPKEWVTDGEVMEHLMDIAEVTQEQFGLGTR